MKEAHALAADPARSEPTLTFLYDDLDRARQLFEEDPGQGLAVLAAVTERSALRSMDQHVAVAQAALDMDAFAIARQTLDAAVLRGPHPNLARLLARLDILTGQLDEAFRRLDGLLAGGFDPRSFSVGERALLLSRLEKMPGREADALRLRAVMPAAVSVYDAQHGVAFTSVPKNACTVIKDTVLGNSELREEYDAGGEPVHNFAARRFPNGVPLDVFNDRDTFRFTVLREPAERLLSAYLNKIAARKQSSRQMANDVRLVVKRAQAISGIEYDPERSISFREFVRYLLRAPDAELNPHWAPQVHFVGKDLSVFDHVGDFRNIEATLTLLETRFGYDSRRHRWAKESGFIANVTPYRDGVKVPNPQLLPAGKLIPMKRTGLPPAAAFLTDPVRRALRNRFSDDVVLYETAARKSGLSV